MLRIIARSFQLQSCAVCPHLQYSSWWFSVYYITCKIGLRHVTAIYVCSYLHEDFLAAPWKCQGLSCLRAFAPVVPSPENALSPDLASLSLSSTSGILVNCSPKYYLFLLPRFTFLHSTFIPLTYSMFSLFDRYQLPHANVSPMNVGNFVSFVHRFHSVWNCAWHLVSV